MNSKEHELKNYENRIKLGQEKLDKLAENEPWVEAESKFFGKEGSKYDFKDLEPIKLEEEIKNLEEEREELSKRINPAISEMFDKTNKW